MYYINKVIHLAIKISKAIMVSLMAVMVVSMFFQVVTRYAMGTGIPWTEELARFANVWLIFIGGSVLAFSNEHIKVTILDSILKEKKLSILQAIRNIIYLVYSIAIINVGINSLKIVSKQTSPNMLLPMNYIYVAIPIGAILTILYLLNNAVAKGKGENNG